MKHLDLFSGIGGFALAARWVGFETIGFCEIDKYAQKVLKKNFPGVPIYEDVTKLNGSQFKDIFLLTGGFPCQDISIAGKGAGLDGERSGLWTELHRIISEVRPKYALIENVPALTFRGGARVIADLTEIGYDTEWQIVGANDVGAPHRRKRIWIVAYSDDGLSIRENKEIFAGGNAVDNGSEDVADSNGCRFISGSDFGGEIPEENGRTESDFRSSASAEDVADSTNERCRLRSIFGRNENRRRSPSNALQSSEGRIEKWAVEPSICRVVDGLPNRVDRLRGLGNAIVPQVAYEIMKGIYDTNKSKHCFDQGSQSFTNSSQ